MVKRHLIDDNSLYCTGTTIPVYLRPSVEMGVGLSGRRNIRRSPKGFFSHHVYCRIRSLTYYLTNNIITQKQ